eukprot:CAMPEP_0204301360 /NCGR_PEP_ID=MMETSP0468-20130131/80233_1 /ASSEMBLY_ACC=CAM_ASM_000383 /TAXON_ID=2969 /ORGANISM="Oxyrrhis marina" /LENGTH=40 /DNA_ID= /DNA_START= /DNA_END= /DNA_ORIENTATION=
MAVATCSIRSSLGRNEENASHTDSTSTAARSSAKHTENRP